jgi:hypothetical protein
VEQQAACTSSSAWARRAAGPSAPPLLADLQIILGRFGNRGTAPCSSKLAS